MEETVAWKYVLYCVCTCGVFVCTHMSEADI